MTTKIDTLLGLQWGDEGKGKVVDVLAPAYDVIARFQAGPNAGHTLEFLGIKHVLHTIPSGIFRDNVMNIIGNGVVIDPVVFEKEINSILPLQPKLFENLVISNRAHLILPTHRLLDAALEAQKGDSKIGSTLKGIGPTYTDKAGRNGLRVGDIFEADFKEKYNCIVKKHKQFLASLNYTQEPDDAIWFASLETLRKFKVTNTEIYIHELRQQGKTVLAEGAQGTLLDIDFGSYPFVTSSNTICAGACTGLGVALNAIGAVNGLFKAYCTRVGSGPFPTELFDNDGSLLRKYGNEFGSTTGRPRRCGWLDLPMLRYAIMLNGTSSLIMTKADVMNDFDVIKIATSYLVNGKETNWPPYNINSEIIPVYKEFKGWKTKIGSARSKAELPAELMDYVAFIEKETGISISLVSVGPDREAIIKM